MSLYCAACMVKLITNGIDSNIYPKVPASVIYNGRSLCIQHWLEAKAKPPIKKVKKIEIPDIVA